MSIDDRLLRTVAAIARSGSLTAAAAELHTSQSALSHLLADYERRLDMPLVNRRQRPLRLTAAGERLLRGAELVLPELERMSSDLAALRARRGQRLYIATECYGCLEWLLPTMDQFRSRHPAVDLDLRLGSGFERVQDCLHGQVDVVITPDASERSRLHFVPLFRFPMVLVCAPRHRLAQRTWIRPSDLVEETLITYPVSTCRLDIYNRFLEPAGLQPAGRVTSELTAIIEQKVASGNGVAALPLWTVREGIDAGRVLAKPLGKSGMISQLYAACRPDDSATQPLIDTFVSQARGIAKTRLPDCEVITGGG